MRKGFTTRKLSASTVAGRYRLEREMARGGMGTVWRGRDEKLGRPVAVKVMSQELASMSEARQRFEREALAAAQLRSNYVVEVYDYGLQEGLPYIVMEMLDGENLGQRLKRVGRMSIHEAAEVLRQVGRGLKSAHDAGLIHRDLKPSNIFLAERDGVETVKLLDFGVVKAMDIEGMDPEEATQSGMLLGTPQYMSPEQARATRELDPRSDVWSAAVILFRMLTGTNPFRGESVGDVVLKICSDDIPRITDVLPTLPPSLDPFFDTAFSRDPAGRFQSAQELVEAFNQILLEEGMAAPVPFGASGELSGVGQSRPSFPAPIPQGAREAYVASPSGEIPPPRASTPHGPATPPSQASLPTPASGHPATPGTPVSAMAAAARVSAPGISGESTPISTTVAGTQLASNWPQPVRSGGAQSVALVVAGAASLITLALVAAIWLSSGPDEPAPSGEPAARVDGDLLSNDDDGSAEPVSTEDVDEEETGDEAPPQAHSTETTETDTPSGEGGAPAASASAVPTGSMPTAIPRPRPTPKSGKTRPNWF